MNTPEVLMPGLEIEEAKPEFALEVARFCQPIYERVYPNDKYGLRQEDFAPWIFETEDTLEYFREVMTNNDKQKSYIARIDGKIVGTICVTEFEDHYEPRCFYVSYEHQGKGIGSLLWNRALDFCTKQLPVRVEVAETNQATIDMYEKWGFSHKPDLGVKMRHWPEWPEGVANAYIYLEKTI